MGEDSPKDMNTPLFSPPYEDIHEEKEHVKKKMQ